MEANSRSRGNGQSNGGYRASDEEPDVIVYHELLSRLRRQVASKSSIVYAEYSEERLAKMRVVRKKNSEAMVRLLQMLSGGPAEGTRDDA